MKIWFVNTNETNLGDLGADIVLNQNRVVIWVKSDLNKIQKGDLILSFHNQKRIIAVGYAISSIKSYELKSHQDQSEESWIDVDWIWKCKKNLSNPIELENIGDNFYSPRQTVEDITNSFDLRKLLEEIGKRKG